VTTHRHSLDSVSYRDDIVVKKIFFRKKSSTLSLFSTCPETGRCNLANEFRSTGLTYESFS